MGSYNVDSKTADPPKNEYVEGPSISFLRTGEYVKKSKSGGWSAGPQIVDSKTVGPQTVTRVLRQIQIWWLECGPQTVNPKTVGPSSMRLRTPECSARSKSGGSNVGPQTLDPKTGGP